MKILAIILILLLFTFSLLVVLQELGKVNISLISKICYYGNNSKLIFILYVVIFIIAILTINAIYHA